MANKNKQNEPIKYGKVAKVPVVMQLEALECGAASLAMILAYYGKWVPLEQVREDCGVSRDGSNALNIIKAARNYGFEANAYKVELEHLKAIDDFPCIIHWNFNHFVVLDGIKNGKAYLNDPARGDVTVSMEEFDRCFTGIVLCFEPTDKFVADGHQKSVISFARKRLDGTSYAVIFMLLTSIITGLMGLISPVFNRIYLDKIITYECPSWFKGFMIGFVAFTILQIIIAFVNTKCSLRINGKMSVVGESSYMWKVLHLPMKFFSQRMAGDIEGRSSLSADIAQSLISTYVPLIIDSGMMVFYLVIVLKYSVFLTAIGITSVVVNFFFSRYMAQKRINITRNMTRDSGKLAGTTVSGIEMIETIKASGAEDGFFERWSGYQAAVNSSEVKYTKLNQYMGVIPSLVGLFINSVVTFFGYYLIITGKFTYGSYMLFSGYLSSFMGPVNSLIGAGQELQEMRTNMERIEDVMEYPDDDIFSSEELKNEDAYKKLSGAIEMKNVTFGYSPLAEPLIKDFNMSVKPGSKVAFVGMSGCGKSTLAKLISGLYKPWSGEISFDGRTFSEIDKSVFRGSLAVVDQDIVIFNDTIANNIRMWDTSIEDFEVILAARDASIHQDIISRPDGYEHVLREGGKDFSGGQKQRIEIARVLAQDPTIIIMDEATSALDAKTEYEVVNSIAARGITCVVIAHRLSTIRDCDEIIVMDHGDVVDRGTHEELMSRGGLYKDLVASE